MAKRDEGIYCIWEHGYGQLLAALTVAAVVTLIALSGQHWGWRGAAITTVALAGYGFLLLTVWMNVPLFWIPAGVVIGTATLGALLIHRVRVLSAALAYGPAAHQVYRRTILFRKKAGPRVRASQRVFEERGWLFNRLGTSHDERIEDVYIGRDSMQNLWVYVVCKDSYLRAEYLGKTEIVALVTSRQEFISKLKRELMAEKARMRRRGDTHGSFELSDIDELIEVISNAKTHPAPAGSATT